MESKECRKFPHFYILGQIVHVHVRSMQLFMCLQIQYTCTCTCSIHVNALAKIYYHCWYVHVQVCTYIPAAVPSLQSPLIHHRQTIGLQSIYTHAHTLHSQSCSCNSHLLSHTTLAIILCTLQLTACNMHSCYVQCIT